MISVTVVEVPGLTKNKSAQRYPGVVKSRKAVDGASKSRLISVLTRAVTVVRASKHNPVRLEHTLYANDRFAFGGTGETEGQKNARC